MDAFALTKKWGFLRNPFKHLSAETERSVLHTYFVEPPYFMDIVGNPSDPSSSIIVGYRGEGKSSICTMIEYYLQKRLSERILIIPYQDFSIWNENELNRLHLDNHIERIIGLGIEKFIIEAQNDPGILDGLNSLSKSKLQWFVLRFLPRGELNQAEEKLLHLFDKMSQKDAIRYYGGWGRRRIASFLRRKRAELDRVTGEDSKSVQLMKALIALISSPLPGSDDLRNQNMLNLLKEFRDIILLCGFRSIYVLVDRLDLQEVTYENINTVAKLVKPLICSLNYLEVEKIATKVFLPTRVREILGGSLRTERITTRCISWSDKNLADMLSRRLQASSNGKIDSLEPFVRPDLWDKFQGQLRFYSASCPRNMIRIIDHIISELCEIETNPEMITDAALHLGIRHFLSVRLNEEDAEEYRQRLDDAAGQHRNEEIL